MVAVSRMLLSMIVTKNCKPTVESSLSRLLLIQNELCNRVIQERLNYMSVNIINLLVLLSIESIVLESFNFDEIFRDFV